MVKQVIIMRKDLNMRKGKIVAQGAHASMAILLDMMRGGETKEEYLPHLYQGSYSMKLNVPYPSPLDEWLRGSFTKICLYVDSEAELEKLYYEAKAYALPVAMIEDNGWTEFKGQKTKTCIAIGPAEAEEIDKITGHLKLL